MSYEYYSTDNFIVTDILKAIIKKSEFYSYETLKGLNALQCLGIKLSTERVKSYHGTYIQAKLAGICLASGWAKDHANEIITDSLFPELFQIELSMNWRDFNPDMSDKTHEDAIKFSLVRGFQSGVRLGQMAKEQLNDQPITTENLVHFLKQHTKEEHEKLKPVSVVKHTQQNCSQLKTQERERLD